MLSNANTVVYHLFIIAVASYNAIIAISQKPFLLSAQNVIVNILNFFGSGTEKLEEELSTLFPQARIIRLDRDTTGKKIRSFRYLKTI